MPEFGYSDDALNVINRFFNADKMLFVEGDDDVVFWEIILEKFSVLGYKVKSVDGREELKKYTNKVNSGTLECAVAKDRDYVGFVENPENDKNPILATYGHSIENSFLTARVVVKAIRSIGRLPISSVVEAEINDWLNYTFKRFENLIFLDAANDIDGCGLCVLGPNCTRFMKSRVSQYPCERKIEEYVDAESLVEKLENSINKVEEKIRNTGRETYEIVRGHFLFSAYLKFANYKIKSNGSSKKVSNDSFFGSCLLSFENSLDSDHPHYDYYKREIKKL